MYLFFGFDRYFSPRIEFFFAIKVAIALPDSISSNHNSLLLHETLKYKKQPTDSGLIFQLLLNEHAEISLF